ncbi:hypothetical protein, partial [Okeania sp.]|uniref:hypothetical protein n=1 Tax=Okeania sp. TaxID=3100323 RepID=UPI002B4B6BCD
GEKVFVRFRSSTQPTSGSRGEKVFVRFRSSTQPTSGSRGAEEKRFLREGRYPHFFGKTE